MPERSSSIRMSRRSSLAGFRRSVTENPETSELLPTQWEGGLDAICILVGPKMSDPPLEGSLREPLLFSESRFCLMLMWGY